MDKLSVRSAGNTFVLALVTWFLLTGLTSLAEAAPMVTLKQAVHFAASDGSDVVAEPGTYQIESAESHLSLKAEGRAPILIDTKPTTHNEEIELPLAVTILGEDQDVLHVVLLLPNGRALDAPGSLSGARPRGVNPAVLSAVQIRTAVLLLPSPPPPASGGPSTPADGGPSSNVRDHAGQPQQFAPPPLPPVHYIQRPAWPSFACWNCARIRLSLSKVKRLTASSWSMNVDSRLVPAAHGPT